MICDTIRPGAKNMKINADFSKRAIVHAAQSDWIASPMAGVDRQMLDRVGDEVARATSIVRYAPGSRFSEHTHSGGEELIVLDGVFQDEHADYPTGSYVRNPIGTYHTPRSDNGCTIFVKLWQFSEVDRKQFSLDLNAVVPNDYGDGVSNVLLHRHANEEVTFETWQAGASRRLSDAGGVELLVLAGQLSIDGGPLVAWDWLRLPPEDSCEAVAGPQGARVWMKRGHLLDIKVPSQD